MYLHTFNDGYEAIRDEGNNSNSDNDSNNEITLKKKKILSFECFKYLYSVYNIPIIKCGSYVQKQLYGEMTFIGVNMMLLIYQFVNRDKDVQLKLIFIRIPIAIVPTLALQISLVSFKVLFFLPLCMFLMAVTGLLSLYLHQYLSFNFQMIQTIIYIVDTISVLSYLFPFFNCGYIFQEHLGPAFTTPVIYSY